LDLLDNKRYLINELAKLSKTTVRTIRYYTSEGLLPQPDSDGKYAYYDENHKKRLDLILRMKAAYLPLKEIRQIMLSLSDEQVTQRLMEQVSTEKKEGVKRSESPGSKKKGSDALNYISNILETQTRYRTNELISKKPALQNQKTISYSQSPLPLDPSDIENWQRIILSPGVELQLRYPADTETNNRVQQLITYAKKIFNKQ